MTRFSEIPVQVTPIPCDLTLPADLKALVDQTLATHGRIDALINCGALPSSQTLDEEDVPDFDRMYHTNVRSIWLLTKYCVEPMSRTGGGSIVNISSINGHRATFMCALYTGTKSAVMAMSRELAVELAPHNIRVNSVSPGAIPHPRRRIDDLFALLHEPYSSQIRNEFGPRMAQMGRNIQPLRMTGHGHDIAMACYYLCSPAARFVTGADLLVDGGKSMEMHEAEPRFHGGQMSIWKQLRMTLLALPDDAWIGEKPKWLLRHRKAQTAKA
jgi:NAD(P)-dependent dehydrogenase (short-subunit alcohol dehydrogenase family)